MGNDSGTVAGQGEIVCIDQPRFYGRENRKEGKDVLERDLRIFRGRYAIKDVIHNSPCRFRSFIIVGKLPVRADHLVGFAGVFPGGEKVSAGVDIPGCQPESVHEIIIRTQRREMVRRREAAEDRQGNGMWEDIANLGSKAVSGRSFIKEQGKKDQGTQDLGLVLSHSADRGIKNEQCNP